MRRQKLIMIPIIIPFIVLGQDYNKAYFNSDWLLTSRDSAIYYRISEFIDSIPAYHGKVTDYYFDTGEKEMTGYYDKGIRNGEFAFYYPNGKLSMTIFYRDGKRTGTWKVYDENGNVRTEINYDHGVEKVIQLNDDNGQSIIKKNKLNYSFEEVEPPTHTWEVTSPIVVTKQIEGKLVNGFRNGKWEVFTEGEKKATLIYENGRLIEGFLLVDGKEYQVTNNLAFPLMNDPTKLIFTEGLFLEPEAIIKNNYVVDALHHHSMTARKTVINNSQELIDYLHENFKLLSQKSESELKLIIFFTNRKPTGFKTIPKLSKSSIDELNTVLSSIEQVNFNVQDSIVIDYKIQKDDFINKN